MQKYLQRRIAINSSMNKLSFQGSWVPDSKALASMKAFWRDLTTSHCLELRSRTPLSGQRSNGPFEPTAKSRCPSSSSTFGAKRHLAALDSWKLIPSLKESAPIASH
eukprot:1946087-Amphidinium_carterae.1